MIDHTLLVNDQLLDIKALYHFKRGAFFFCLYHKNVTQRYLLKLKTYNSPPNIAGRGIANTVAACWTGAMMLDHLGETEAADAIVRAIETVTEEDKVLMPDLGGTAGTEEVVEAVMGKLW